MVRPWETFEDDVRILSSSYILNRAETQALRLRTAERYTQLRYIDANAGPEPSQRTLALKQALTQANMVAESLLAPVRKLPAEILGEIFMHTVPELSIEGALELPPTPFEDEEWYPQTVRLALLLVCRQWSIVAFDTPRIWTTLTIDNDLDFDDLERAVTHSRGLPLDLYIAQRAFLERPDDIAALLRPEIHRIQRLVFAAPEEDNACILFPRDQLTDAPILKVFISTSIYEEDFPDNPVHVLLGKIHAPCLDYIGLKDDPKTLLFFSADSLRNMRRLVMRTPVVQAQCAAVYLKLLASCPSVTELEIAWLAAYWEGKEYLGGTVSLLSLKSLVIKVSYDFDTAEFLRFIRVPHLESLSIGLDIEEAEFNNTRPRHIEAGLRALHADTAASLQNLRFDAVDLVGTDAPLIPPFYNLVLLHFSECHVGEAILRSLTPSAPFSTSWPCPRLSRLVFTQATFNVHGYAVIALVRNRTCQDGAERQPSCPTHITLDGCDIIDDGVNGAELKMLAGRRRRTLTLMRATPDGGSVVFE